MLTIVTEISTTTGSFAVSGSNGCVKCGMSKKSGKRSCCARGGAWFKNCGDAGDKKFDHTWVEGIQACEGYASFSVEAQVMRHVGIIPHVLNISKSRNTTKQNADIDFFSSVSNAGTRSYEDYVRLTVGNCILFIISHLQT